MKKTILLTLALLLFIVSVSFAADVYVNGYYRSDGTYVNGYYRTAPNSTKSDNYSTSGNINPYTGKKGTKKSYGNSYNNSSNNSSSLNNLKYLD